MSRRRTPWSTILLVLILGLAWAAWERFAIHRLTAENRSGQSVTILRITVGGRTSEFRDLRDGAASDSRFQILSDDSFAVERSLADGTKIEGSLGYVINGMIGERASFEKLTGGGIEWKQSRGY